MIKPNESIKSLLQKITKNNSDSLYELSKTFREKFPEENGLSDLLKDLIFSEEENAFRDDAIIRMLTNLMEGKA